MPKRSKEFENVVYPARVYQKLFDMLREAAGDGDIEDPVKRADWLKNRAVEISTVTNVKHGSDTEYPRTEASILKELREPWESATIFLDLFWPSTEVRIHAYDRQYNRSVGVNVESDSKALVDSVIGLFQDEYEAHRVSDPLAPPEVVEVEPAPRTRLQRFGTWVFDGLKQHSIPSALSFASGVGATLLTQNLIGGN
ncbi:hypothetical protein [Marisediminicola sp. LYQ85]|uniref:hypothetical protein n=1 Tax=Marisediminicola sp. LYQ85 TaxID=3391062 RepID=UPI00398364E7